MDINALMAELAQYIRLQEEAAATVEALKDQIKAQMTAAGVDTMVGAEHKATYGDFIILIRKKLIIPVNF